MREWIELMWENAEERVHIEIEQITVRSQHGLLQATLVRVPISVRSPE